MSLRTKVLRGGAYLVLRQGLGIAIGTFGIVLLTRALGPEAYGLYMAAFGINVFLISLSSWGVNIYLIRQEEEPQPRDYHQAFSLLLLFSSAGTGSAILLLPLLERWMQIEGFGPVAIAVFLLLPVTVLGMVPMARLERALNYRAVALIELSGQIILYAVSLPLAYRGLGPWAPVAGLWAKELFASSLLYWASAYWPRLHWEPARVRAMSGYGLGYSTSLLLSEAHYLVNPLIVGRYAGAEAVGYVALAMRIAEQLSFVTTAVSRIATAALARLQKDRARLAKAISEGLSLQVMVLGPILGGFGLVAPWIFPLVFGSSWLPVLEVYPFLALFFLFRAGVNLYVYSLYVLRKNWEVAAVFLVHLILLTVVALLLVPHLGLRGYGWAEMAAIPSYVLFLVWFQFYIGGARYAPAMVWFTAWAVALFSWQLGPWAWVSIAAPLLWSKTRTELLQAVAVVLRSIRGP